MAKKAAKQEEVTDDHTYDDGNGGETSHAPPVWSRKMWSSAANIEVAVFAREVTRDNGTFTAYNVSVKRTYKKDDEYRTSIGFRGEDVPTLIQLLSQAYGFISHTLAQKNG